MFNVSGFQLEGVLKPLLNISGGVDGLKHIQYFFRGIFSGIGQCVGG
jgi:hypothetical protein